MQMPGSGGPGRGEILFNNNEKIVSEYDQEIPQSQTADKPMTS